jgi:hypothetical protein
MGDDAYRPRTSAPPLHPAVSRLHQPKRAMTVSRSIEQWLEVAKVDDTTCDRYSDLTRLYIDLAVGHSRAAGLTSRLPASHLPQIVADRPKSVVNAKPCTHLAMFVQHDVARLRVGDG